MAIIKSADGQTITPIKNLGWLLRHWRDVKRFVVEETNYPDMGDCFLRAILRDGREYGTFWESRSVCREWLRRPVFRTAPLRWFGVDTEC